jgi:hypothetical protein
VMDLRKAYDGPGDGSADGAGDGSAEGLEGGPGYNVGADPAL